MSTLISVLAVSAGFVVSVYLVVKHWHRMPEGYENENGFHFGMEPVNRPAPRLTISRDRAA